MSRRMMLEHVNEPLLPKHRFIQRILTCLLLSSGLLLLGSSLGAWGFYAFEGMTWLDSFLNAVMLMTGLGLEQHLHTTAGKVFTIIYSLISPLVFYSTLIIFFTPILHRMMHYFHLDIDNDKD